MKKFPLLTIAPTSIAILSIAGMPPLLGFFPKILALSSLLNSHMWITALLLVLSSLLSLFFYMNASIPQLSNAPYLHKTYENSWMMIIPSILPLSIMFLL